MSATTARRSPTARQPREPLTTEQLGRFWDWAVMISLVVCVIFVLITVIGPTVRYRFSGERRVVDTLSTSSVYVGGGAEPADSADAAAIAGIIGTRPLAVVSLSSSDSLAGDTLATCSGVVDQIPQLVVAVIVDGAMVAGCEGKDVRLAAGVDFNGWDYVFWQTQSGADSLLVGDVPAIARQLALAYDAEVKGGRLIGAEREFSAPANRWVLPVVLAAIVVVAAVAVFFLLQWLARRYLAARDRSREWEAERDRIDGELGDIAMIMVGVEPADRDSGELIRTVAALSEDYLRALNDLDAAGPGDDLSSLASRVGGLRQRLESAAAPGLSRDDPAGSARRA